MSSSINPINILSKAPSFFSGMADKVSDQVASVSSKLPAPTDSVNVTAQTGKNNPYNGISSQSASVKVSPWVKGGDNSNSTLSGILASQGYSHEEMFAKDASGKSLLDKVAATNNLKNPNLIIAGQSLVVPSKGEQEGDNGLKDVFGRLGDLVSGAVSGSAKSGETRESGDSHRMKTGGDEDLNTVRFLRDNAEAIGSVDTGGSKYNSGKGTNSFTDEDLDHVAALHNSRHAKNVFNGEISTRLLKENVSANAFSGVASMFTDRNQSQIADTIESLRAKAPKGLSESETNEWIQDLAKAAHNLESNRQLRAGLKSQDMGNDSWSHGEVFSAPEMNEYVRIQTADAA